MKPENKSFLIAFLFSGSIYAIISAGFDYFNGEGFDAQKFLYNFLALGLVMGLLFRYNRRKQIKKEQSGNK